MWYLWRTLERFLRSLARCFCFVAAKSLFTNLQHQVYPNLFYFLLTYVHHKGTTSQLPQHLAHLQVHVVAPHLDFKTIMDAVPAEPGLADSCDPFADPIAGMRSQNFAVVKIGNVSRSFYLPLRNLAFRHAMIMFIRFLMLLPKRRSPTSSVVMPKPT